MVNDFIRNKRTTYNLYTRQVCANLVLFKKKKYKIVSKQHFQCYNQNDDDVLSV